MKKLCVVILAVVLSSGWAFAAKPAPSPCEGQKKEFSFNMPILVGSTVFNDRVEICKIGGKRVGQLTVPKRFKAVLENIKHRGNRLSFSITADEGRGKFQVFYKGKLKENKKFFIGMAKLEKGKSLGPFMGFASDQNVQLKMVQ